MTRNEDTGASLEKQVYCQHDAGTGKPRYFFVARMVEFARDNLPLAFVKADPVRAKRMVENGTVDAAYVLKLTAEEHLAPIVLCVGAEKDGGDLLIDGNHRYVAWTLAKKERGLEMSIPAFLVYPEDWTRFIVPDKVVSRLDLADPGVMTAKQKD
jgi:hypothetical protein